ncbi:MarR family transcriptional regulator [Catenovulum sp. 2E275]|uniref:MarR family winged helix-turn-helix transcriptional regulator n=1 Tax=Catenovulum sp. 2E275 TaxID=2980497 RepID=UPI0021D25852|nr:MarR family transcriptional regulator [Catenovulum sp. 2E275]MCU4676310.1 MarR family transcriptional regulator [Catenovulum sp. 2E275]
MLNNDLNKFFDDINKNWPELTSSTNPEIIKLYKIVELSHKNLELFLRDFGLSPSEFSLLSTLRRCGHPFQLTPTELSQSMIFSSGGMSKLLVRLSQKKMIKRSVNSKDKRSHLVTLTQSGKEKIETVMPQLHALESNYFARFTLQEKSSLNMLLDKMLNNLTKKTI